MVFDESRWFQGLTLFLLRENYELVVACVTLASITSYSQFVVLGYNFFVSISAQNLLAN